MSEIISATALESRGGILSHADLCAIVDEGVITNVAPDMINAASIDITVGNVFFVEDVENPRLVVIGDTAEERVGPNMKRIVLEKGESIILKPGQVALCASEQVFNLPANLSCEYKEKSSMGRSFLQHMMAGWCFTADTEVAMLDGSSKKIADVVVGDKVYSILPNGDFSAGEVTRAGKTGTVSRLVRVTLDDGGEFTCTPEHMIMTRTGGYVAAMNLVEGEALMPLHRKLDSAGYEMVYCPHQSRKSNWEKLHGRWKYTHRLVAKAPVGSVAHHKNENIRDNRPENLEVMPAGDHATMHRVEYARSEEGRAKSSAGATERNEKLWKDETFREAHAKRSSVGMSEVNRKIWADPEHRTRMSALSKARFAATLGKSDPVKTQRASKLGFVKSTIAKILAAGKPVSGETYTSMKRQNAPTVDTLVKTFGSFDETLKLAGYANHKVAGVHIIDVPPTDVYDLTVEGEHNFALSCGVVVHNCDAGWHGSVLTMEIKNVTEAHDIAIRPGVRLGQMIFFPHAPVTEEASYAKRGRYNGDTEAKEVKP